MTPEEKGRALWDRVGEWAFLDCRQYEGFYWSELPQDVREIIIKSAEKLIP
ncbi:MAG: hypothetical protein JSR30_00310 [Proteobacteria bacterium]|nr:hypothetical protein [Pseudomonadota bacterium]